MEFCRSFLGKYLIWIKTNVNASLISRTFEPCINNPCQQKVSNQTTSVVWKLQPEDIFCVRAIAYNSPPPPGAWYRTWLTYHSAYTNTLWFLATWIPPGHLNTDHIFSTLLALNNHKIAIKIAWHHAWGCSAQTIADTRRSLTAKTTAPFFLLNYLECLHMLGVL